MTKVQVAVLRTKAFWDEYYKAFTKVRLRSDDTEREKFRETVFEIQGAIVEALKSKWTESTDFEVAWDFNYCRHVCGGIYSEAIFGGEYVQAIANALATVDARGKWTYHTACEILVNPAGRTVGECTENRGQFFVRGGTCYIDSRMKPVHR